MSNKYKILYNKLALDWQKFRADSKNKKIRIRDAANILDTNEASLLSTQINNDVVFLSIPDISVFFKQLNASVRLMFLVRNDSIVHENNICSEDLVFSHDVIFDNIDTKQCLIEFDSNKISYTFYESKIHRDRLLESFQFFDIYGQSILKIYLKEQNSDLFKKLASNYKMEYNYELQKNIFNNKNLKAYVSGIENIRMPFKFNSTNILKHSIKNDLTKFLLDKFSKNKIEIQIHVNGNNVVQYYRGLISNIVQFGSWINVLDKKFNLHAIEEDINTIMIYKYNNLEKPDYSIEFFDKNNNHLMGFAHLIGFNNHFEEIINSLGAFNE